MVIGIAEHFLSEPTDYRKAFLAAEMEGCDGSATRTKEGVWEFGKLETI